MFRKCSCLHRAAVLITGLLLLCGIAAYAGVSTSNGLFVPLDVQTLTDVQEITVDQPEILSCAIVEGGMFITPHDTGCTEIVAGEQILAVADCGKNGFVYDR